jgi:hypothetical protein
VSPRTILAGDPDATQPSGQAFYGTGGNNGIQVKGESNINPTVDLSGMLAAIGQLLRTTNASEPALTTMESIENDADKFETGREDAEELKRDRKNGKESPASPPSDQKYPPNSTICAVCGGPGHPQDGLDAYQTGAYGEVIDTLRLNNKTGKVDPIPTVPNIPDDNNTKIAR